METLQILGWVYLGLSIGVISGIFILGLFQAGRVKGLEREIDDLNFKNRILRGENERLTKRGKPQPRKRRNWKKKPVKKQTDFLISDIYQCMTKQEKQHLELIVYRMDEADKKVESLHKEFKTDLQELHSDIKFIKENLFNPETGLWAETKQNSAFRKNTTMWRGIIGGGLIAALVESFWGMFTN